MDEIRNAAYEQLSDTQKEKYSSFAAADFYSKLIELCNIDEYNRERFIHTIADVVLGISDIDQCRKTLLNELHISEELVTQTIRLLTDYCQGPPTHIVVTPMHTMADDVEKVYGYSSLADAAMTDDEPVYTSSQDTILNKPKIADTPAYTPTTTEPHETATNTTDKKTATKATPEPADTRWSSSYETK